MESRQVLLAFNRGLVSPLAMARGDIKRMAMSAEEQTNYMPRVLGAMSLRPGTRKILNTKDNAAATYLEFVYSSTDTALIELTNLAMRVVVSDSLITRIAVSTAISNGTFTTDLTDWTDKDGSGCTSSWASNGMNLVGNGTLYASREQLVTVAAGDQNKEHGLAIRVLKGTAILRVGSSSNGGQYIADMVLREGYHSIAITPTGDFYLRLSSNTVYATVISSVAVEASGVMTVTTPWPESSLQGLRYEQSGDVVFVASRSYRQVRIERQASRSWSVVRYYSNDGPFRPQDLTTTTMTVGALTGSTTLTASTDYFKSTNVGSLFRLASIGQTVELTINAENTFTNPIRVTGVDSGRIFSKIISGTWVGKITLQRSAGEIGDWTDVSSNTSNTSVSVDDTLDNQIIYYRLGIKAGDYTSGDAVCNLSYAAGSIEGIGIVTSYTSPTVVNIDVLKAFGKTTATPDWWEGSWSDRRGWPSSVVLYDGRLWFAGADKIAGSVSDAFDSFDDTVEGDSGPIFRSIGSGPVDTINWMLSLPSLVVGTQGSELVAKASSLDEPLTPTAFSLKPASTLGSAAVRAIKVDTGGVYVQRGGSRVYEIALDGATYNYVSNDLTSVIPEIGDSGILRIAVQRQPDTRIHCVRADGKVGILVFDRLEKVTCWVLYETNGVVEDVIVLPGLIENEVFYVVKRVINSATVRFLEKWALESESRGDALTVLSDCTLTSTGSSRTVITGLDALEGESVVVWGNTKDLGTYTVTSGSITLTEAVTTCYVGLPYTATFQSAKFATASEVPLLAPQQIHHVGLMLKDTHAQGITFGQDFTHMYGMPQIDDNGAQVDQDNIWDSYNADSIPSNSSWDRDTRLCLKSVSPRPCTILAAVVSVTGHAK